MSVWQHADGSNNKHMGPVHTCDVLQASEMDQSKCCRCTDSRSNISAVEHPGTYQRRRARRADGCHPEHRQRNREHNVHYACDGPWVQLGQRNGNTDAGSAVGHRHTVHADSFHTRRHFFCAGGVPVVQCRRQHHRSSHADPRWRFRVCQQAGNGALQAIQKWACFRMD